MTRIGIITSSTRPARIGPKVAGWVASLAPDGVETDVVDLGELALPFFADQAQPAKGTYDQATTLAWSERVKGYDGILLLVAEYNAGYTAPLKNALDTLYQEWEGKPTALVGYGHGGGGRALTALGPVLRQIKVAQVGEPAQLFFGKTLTQEGEILDGAPAVEVRGLYAALVEATRGLTFRRRENCDHLSGQSPGELAPTNDHRFPTSAR